MNPHPAGTGPLKLYALIASAGDFYRQSTRVVKKAKAVKDGLIGVKQDLVHLEKTILEDGAKLYEVR